MAGGKCNSEIKTGYIICCNERRTKRRERERAKERERERLTERDRKR